MREEDQVRKKLRRAAKGHATLKGGTFTMLAIDSGECLCVLAVAPNGLAKVFLPAGASETEASERIVGWLKVQGASSVRETEPLRAGDLEFVQANISTLAEMIAQQAREAGLQS